MIDFRELLKIECTRSDQIAASKKSALERASELIEQHQPKIDARHVLEALMARERLGSTALGQGVAVPHCRIECDSPAAAFIHLQRPIDFDAPDQVDVDLLFVLVVPEQESTQHLDILATLARIFYLTSNLDALRLAESDKHLLDVMIQMIARTATP
jgi:PTS system nitrogen regulatory IIA component